MKTIRLRTPYVIFLGDVADPGYAKTGYGLAEWRRELCVGQIRFDGCPIDLDLPDLGVDDLDNSHGSLVIGVAPPGGSIPGEWIDSLVGTAVRGIDVVAGMHTKLNAIPELAAAARRSGARLIDIRTPPESIPIGTGTKRSGLRLLTVGTDCAVGKKYTALALQKEMSGRGLKTDFRASGQTGIMIAGSGIAIDCVICDFTAGAAELLSPDNEADHWDVVEGQGSLFHPSYAGVSLGLLHGTQPDAIVLCHDATRRRLLGLAQYAVPALADAIERNLVSGSLTNPAIRCVGVSVNTSRVPHDSRKGVLQGFADETGLPCVDPLIEGVGPIVDRLLAGGS